MKITIIHPCIGRIPGKDYIRSWQMQPLPAAYQAALIPKDVSIAFFDDRLEPIPFDETTDLVAMSVETYTAKRAYQIATEYRRRGVPVVMGGFHPTLVPNEVLEYAEAVVVGEAEQTFPQLIEDFRNGRMKRLYLAGGRSDISSIAPDRSLFVNKRYLKLSLIEAARGCHFKCEFCAISSFFDATQSRRPLERVIDEIKELKKHSKLFFFVDDNIVSYPKWAKEFYRALIPLKIRWVSQASITMAKDPEMLSLMKESGCQGVLIGFESLNPQNLDRMNKGFNKVTGGYETVVKELRKHRLRIYATFVFGYEHDTLESFAETVDFCIRNRIFMAAFNHLTPFPGTPLYRKLQDEGKLLYDKWWLDGRYRYGQVPFQSSLDPIEIMERCVKARKSFYSIRSIFRRMFSRTNSGSFFMLNAFWFINLLLRKEATQRENYPLGDLAFEGELMKVRNATQIQKPALVE